jgi:aminopeptidase N
MSPYLLAFVAGELQKKTATSKHGVEVNVWSTKAQTLSSLDFALDIATRAVDFYDDYFGTPYPLPKADHVAIPDFSAGAMENWGLITYRERALLAEKNAAQETKEYVSSVIAHELSHQWFGNLVTMRWWNNLWLNESFASIMEYVCMDALEPSWHVWDNVTMQEGVQALRRDAIDGVQAVQTEVRHPDEINSLFDGAIVYAKGARLMRMMYEYVGTTPFRAGLQSYFKKHAYHNTEATDLWDAMSKASGKDVERLMDAWISQPGYPVVTVDDDGLSQERFFIGEHTASNTLWPIPLFAHDPALPELLVEKFVRVQPGKNVLLNTGDRAHFITRYDSSRLAELHEQIATSQLASVDRLRLLHEQSLLVEAELVDAGEIIPLLLAYRQNVEEPVWAMVVTVARNLRAFVESNEQAKARLGEFYKELVRLPYERLGWHTNDGEPTSDTQLRADILNLVVHSHDEGMTAEAQKIFDAMPLADIDPNIRASVLRAVLERQQDDTVFDGLLSAYRKSSSPELKQDLMYALASTTTSHAKEILLAALTDSSVIRPQDLKLWVMLLLHTPETRYDTWRWLVENWAWIDKTFHGDMSYERFLQYCGNYLSTRNELEEFHEFVTDKRDIPALTRTIAIAEKQIAARVSLLEHQSTNVVNALEQF